MAVIDGSLMVTEERHVASAMPSWPDGVEGTLAKRSRLMLNSVDADPQLIAGWQPFLRPRRVPLRLWLGSCL
jgi:hypothetical protein